MTATSAIYAGLEQLLAAIHANDPKRELLVRVGDLMREVDALSRLPAQAANEPSDALGRWLSAALDDPTVCAEMKADISAWFAAGQLLPAQAVTEQGDNEPCYYCGKPCKSLAGDPGEWPVALCHPDDPGKVKWHHTGCVSARLHGRISLDLPAQAVGEGARSSKDFAIEHAEYMARAVDAFMDFLNKTGGAARVTDQGAMTEHWRGVQSCIYEFRKRAQRAALPSPPAEPSGEMVEAE